MHDHGGVLLELLKMLHLHADIKARDRLFWFTTTGWMMWNFLSGGLLTDGSIVLYDGNPAHPDLGTLWTLAEEAGITCFGTSASYIAACMKAGISPRDGRDLAALVAVGSTGSPLAPEGFDWVYDELGPDVWLFSTSGGTDLCTAFVGGVPTLPVYRGELQARALGASVEAWNADGVPVIGEVGELVITEPMPSMPIRLWGDDDGTRYRSSYFDRFPGVWRHGDWIEVTERGTAVITGRSDATINRGGIRMGTGGSTGRPRARRGRRCARRRPPARGDAGVHAALRRPAARRRARRDPRRDDPLADSRGLLAPTRARRGTRRPGRAENPVGEGARGAREADPLRGPVDSTVSRDSLSDPDALRPFEELAASWGAGGSVPPERAA